LVAVLDHLKRHGEVDGKKLLEDFGRAPFGWFKDTTRYLVASLLVAGRIRIRVGAEWIKVPGEKAVEGLKNNNAFAKVDVATNEESLSPETLLQAANRLLAVTGKKVLPMPQQISTAVQEFFPGYQREYASMPSELTAAGLPGAERAEQLQKQLTQALQGDASEAPTVLGAATCDLVDNLLWAREVRKALEQRIGETASTARTLLAEIPRLPQLGAAESLQLESATVQAELKGLLEREDFHALQSDIRNRVQDLQALVKTAAGKLTDEFTSEVVLEREAIRDLPKWLQLPPEKRTTHSAELDRLEFPRAENLDGMRQLANLKLQYDGVLNRVRKAVQEYVPEAAPASVPAPETKDSRRIKAKRRYATGAEVQPLIDQLQQAASTEGPIDLELE
jgi:hypothetical protein